MAYNSAILSACIFCSLIHAFGQNLRIPDGYEISQAFSILSSPGEPSDRRRWLKDDKEDESDPLIDFPSCLTDRIENETLYKEINQPGTILWSPPPDKYVIPFCYTGQATNQLRCFRKFIFFAGILNRTLLFNDNPLERKYRVDIQPSVDLDHIRACHGNNTVLSFSEYVKRHQKKIIVDQIVCWGVQCPSHKDRLPGSTLSKWKEVEILPNLIPGRTRLKHKATVEEISTEFAKAKGSVLFVGDIFGKKIVGHRNVHMFGKLPFLRSRFCSSAITLVPLPSVVRAARLFVEAMFGDQKFMGIHFRRGDFQSYCKSRPANCFPTIMKAGSCIKAKMAQHNIQNLLVAMNGNKQTERDLREALSGDGVEVNVVFLQEAKREENSEWQRPLANMNHFTMVAFDKMACAYSDVFLGSPLSTFSRDIERIRYGLRLANCSDSYICDDEEK